LAIVFGGGYGGWSFAHQPFAGRPWDGHAYFGAAVGYLPADHELNRRAVRYPTADHPAAVHEPSTYTGRAFTGESHVQGYRTETSSRSSDARTYEARGSRGATRGGGSAHEQGAARGVAHF
jgi:hypothetical protein